MIKLELSEIMCNLIVMIVSMIVTFMYVLFNEYVPIMIHN